MTSSPSSSPIGLTAVVSSLAFPSQSPAEETAMVRAAEQCALLCLDGDTLVLCMIICMVQNEVFEVP